MGAIAIPILIIVVAVVAAGLAAKGFVQRRRAKTDAMRAKRQVLHYNVPEGYDPAEVIIELHRAGYEAVPDATVGQSGELLIGGRGDASPDREEIRRILTVIAQGSPIGDPGWHSSVRFMDE